MAKQIDYAKLKALSQQIIECIGDDEEGENPDLPKQDDAIGDGGQDEIEKLEPLDTLSAKEEETDRPSGNKRKDDAIRLMGATLATRLKKR